MKSVQPSPEYQRAASRLTLTDVFFTALLYSMKVEQDDTVDTLATNGMTIFYNPKGFKEKLNDQERVFALVHELLHVILFHSMRRGIRDVKMWNVACDYAVNALCREYGHTLPKWVLYDPEYAGMGAEKIYDLLGKKGGAAPPSNPMSGDVGEYVPGSGAGDDVKEVERAIGLATEAAIQAAKAAGTLSAGMKRMRGEAQVSREPWYQHLRRYMSSMHSRQYNWNRINARRAVFQGVVSPESKTESMGKVVFGVDCSGSITDRQLSAMSAHIADVLKDCTPSGIVVVYFDSTVCHVDEFAQGDIFSLEPHGGGGTNFQPVFDYVSEHHSDAQLVVMLTDMYGSMEDDMGIPSLWVTQTEGRDAPFGDMIHADFNE